MFDEQRRHLIALLSYLLRKGGQGLGSGPGSGLGSKSGSGFEPLNPFALPSSSSSASVVVGEGEGNKEISTTAARVDSGGNKSPVKGAESKTTRGLLARVKGVLICSV